MIRRFNESDTLDWVGKEYKQGIERYNADTTFKRGGITYFIEFLDPYGSNYLAKWWDNSDNGLGYNNQGFVVVNNPFNRMTGYFSPENIDDYLVLFSDYDRKPPMSIQRVIFDKVKRQLDYDALNDVRRTNESIKRNRQMRESADNTFYCAECTYTKSGGVMSIYTTDITEVRRSTMPKDSLKVEGSFLVRRKYFRSEYEAQEYIDSLPNAMPMSRNESIRRNRRMGLREDDASLKTNYAVIVYDMNTASYNLYTGTKKMCEQLYKDLFDFNIDDYDDDEKEDMYDWLYDRLNEFNCIERIDFRRGIDYRDNYSDGYDKYHIINYTKPRHPISLYL